MFSFQLFSSTTKNPEENLDIEKPLVLSESDSADLETKSIEEPHSNNRIGLGKCSDLLKKFILGTSKVFSLAGVGIALYSYLKHGEDNTELTENEIHNYITSLFVTSGIVGVFESLLSTFPHTEMRILSYWNSLIQMVDIIALESTLILDNSCQEILKPQESYINTFVLNHLTTHTYIKDFLLDR